MEAIAVRPEVAVPIAETAVQPVSSYILSSLPALESALAGGLHAEWRQVVDADPLATLFQTTGWCMPWYRAYVDAFDPYVIVVTSGGRVVGVAPMAVDPATRALGFASHAMADYRDIVALPGYREQVVGELIRHYLDGRFAGPLQVGWTDPASDTPSLVAKVCAQRGLGHAVRHQPCYRWFPPAPAKPSAQKFLNWYKRNGKVSFDVIDSEPAWERFREEYYRQHTLRQIQAGRPTSFDDARKAALYEAVFHSPEVQAHVTAFSVDGRMLAGHFGYVWRGVLMLGPPSIRLEDEQRSPAVILLSWIIQNAQSLGLKGFDLTIGDSDFKKRLGNQCVQLTMVEVHGSPARYHLQAARDGIVSTAKRAAERALGDGAWKGRVKPAADELAFQFARWRELGPAGALRDIASAASRWIYDPGIERLYVLTPGSIAGAAEASPGMSARENCVEDLLRWQGTSPTIARAMTACARSYARLRNTGHTLHTLLADDALAGWCYSSAAGIQDVFVLPGLPVAAAARLLREAAAAQFSRGATELRLTIAGEDRMLESAAAATGRLSAETRTPRLFGSSTRLDRAARLWRRLTWRAVKRRIALALRYEAEERTYRLSRDEAAELPASDDFARDRWEDLDRFVPTEPRHVREDVIEDWRQRRARGEHVYTRIEDGRLAAYGWVVERQKTAPLTWVKQTVELPDHAAVIYDFYTLPEYRHRDFYQRLLMHAMQDAARMPGIQWICLSILASDHVPRWWVERIGMQYCDSHFYRRVLCWTKKWQQTSTPMRSTS